MTPMTKAFRIAPQLMSLPATSKRAFSKMRSHRGRMMSSAVTPGRNPRKKLPQITAASTALVRAAKWDVANNEFPMPAQDPGGLSVLNLEKVILRGFGGVRVYKVLGLAYIPLARSAKHYGFNFGLRTNIGNRLVRGNRTRCKYRHCDRTEPAGRDHSLIMPRTATHAKPDFVDIGTNDRVIDSALFELIQQAGCVHCDEARFRVVAVLHVLSEYFESIVHSQPKKQICNHVLKKDYRGLEP